MDAKRDPDPQTQNQEVPPWMGLIFIAIGSLMMAFGEPSPGVPHWVVYVACSMFILTGIMMVSVSLGQQLVAQIVSPLIVLFFGVIFSWIGFAPGERECAGSLNLLGYEIKSLSSCKLPFAIAATAFWLFFVALISYIVIELIKKRRKN